MTSRSKLRFVLYCCTFHFVINVVQAGNPVPDWSRVIHVDASNFTLGCTPDNGWSNSIAQYTSGPPAGVLCSANSQGGTQNARAQCIMTIQTAIPDGDYFVRIGIETGNHTTNSSIYSVAMGLVSGQIGSYTENGGSGTSYWHTYYPTTASSAHDYNAYFAGPAGSAGWYCPVSSSTALPNYITVAGIDAGDLQLDIWDQTSLNYDLELIKYIDFIPVTIGGQPYLDWTNKIHVDANNMTFTWSADSQWPNSKAIRDLTYGIYCLWDPNSAGNAKGTATLYLPVAIPDGDYAVNVGINTGNHQSGSVFAVTMGLKSGAIGSVVENGGSGGWHTYYPGATNAGKFYETRYAGVGGSNGWYCTVNGGSAMPTSVTLKGIDPNELCMTFWDESYLNYDCEIIKYIDLIPIRTSTNAFLDNGQAIRIQAVDCGITSEADPCWPTSVAEVSDSSVLCMGGGGVNMNAEGKALLTVPTAIPDGNYAVNMSISTGNHHDGALFAVSTGLAAGSTGTLTEIGGSGGWHTYYPAAVNAAQTYVPRYASPAGSNGWYTSVYAGSALPTSLYMHDIRADNLQFDFWDETSWNYDCEAVNYIELVPMVTHQYAFDIGACYTYYVTGNPDNFGYDYALMDLARHGTNQIVVSGNVWYASQFFATAKSWGISCITAYNILTGLGNNPVIDQNAMTNAIVTECNNYDSMTYNGAPVGDIVVGKMLQDEAEGGSGLTAGQQEYLSTYADLYRVNDPNRQCAINHCDPPWYDVNEQLAFCSTGPTIEYNSSRFTSRFNEAQRLGRNGFTAYAQTEKISTWMNNDCGNLEYYGFTPCTQALENWLAQRSAYNDVYEEVMAAYNHGCNGLIVFKYGEYTVGDYYEYSLVDNNGIDVSGKLQGFGDAANNIRWAQGWPTVTLTDNNGNPFTDNANISVGSGTLTVKAVATVNKAPIANVIFGMSTDGGATWTTVEDTTAPYTATFSVSTANNVIFRSQAVDVAGRTSIYAANMVNIVQ